MRVTVGGALVLMSAFAGMQMIWAQSPVPGDTRPAQTATQKDLLAAEFEKLRFDYGNAVAKFEDRDAPRGRLLGGEIKVRDMTGHPAHEYLQRFKDIAGRTGNPAYGLIANQDLIVVAGVVGDTQAQDVAVTRLVEHFADTPGMEKFISSLPARPEKGFIVPISATPRAVYASMGLFDGFFMNLPPAQRAKKVLDVLTQIDNATTSKSVKTGIVNARMQMARMGGDAALEKKYYEELIAKYPDSPQAKVASADVHERDTLSVGSTVPDFEAVDAQGTVFKLSDYRGKVVLLDFWGFWCAPCTALLPYNIALSKKYEGQPFAMLGINSDKDRAMFDRQARKVGINFRNAMEKSTTGTIPAAWNVKSWPTLYVIDPNGVIVAKFVGGEHEDIEAAVAQAMAGIKAATR